MITKNTTYHAAHDVTVLAFGSGDIMMHSFRPTPDTRSEDAMYGVCFREHVARPIGELAPEYNGLSVDALRPDVLMHFSKVESIDALILTLQECRAQLAASLDS